MKQVFSLLLTTALISLFVSCSGRPGGVAGAEGTDPKKELQGPDTAKLKAEVDGILHDLTNNKLPDTNKLKMTTADVLTTTANVLSDSGIDAMGGNEKDEGVMKAKDMFKNMRDSMGISPAMLDSMRNSAKQLAPAR